MQAALRLLGYRARSIHELHSRLLQKGFSPPVADRTVARLLHLGLLDDDAFAHDWVTMRPGRGPARLRQELRLKGVASAVVEKAIQDGLTAEQELTAAWRIAARAIRTHTVPLAPADLLRVRRMLQRRGFSYEVVKSACARLSDHLTNEEEWLE